MPNVALAHPECVTERDGTGVAQEQAAPEGDRGPVPGHPQASPRKHSARYVRSTAPEAEQHTTPAPRTMPTFFIGGTSEGYGCAIYRLKVVGTGHVSRHHRVRTGGNYGERNDGTVGLVDVSHSSKRIPSAEARRSHPPPTECA